MGSGRPHSECGPQATGGNFTDWEQVTGMANMGYPIAEISPDGSFICTKPGAPAACHRRHGSGADAARNRRPQAYILPDVVCDFSTATLEQVGENRVRVTGATGRPAPDSYKVSATYADQFRGGTYMTFYGIDADKKPAALGEAVFEASRNVFKAFGLADFSETSIELIGAESQFGKFAQVSGSREVAAKIAARHPDAMGIGILLKGGGGTGSRHPPGACPASPAAAPNLPVVRLFSFTIAKSQVAVRAL